MSTLDKLMEHIYVHHDVCKEALDNDNIFNNFKSNHRFTPILEHTTFEFGATYLNLIRSEFSDMLDMVNWDKIGENDLIGNTQKFKFDGLDGEYSPSTIAYVYKGMCILNELVKFGLLEPTLLEIGGGYGGQCKILFDLQEIFGVNIKQYTIIDLKYVSRLQQKYLTKLGYSDKIKYVEFEEILDSDVTFSDDYLISIYALGEFFRDLQDFYIDKIKDIQHYYIIWNSLNIHEHFFRGSTVIDEKPKTGRFNKTITK